MVRDAVILVALLLVSSSAPALAATATVDATIEEVRYKGDGKVQDVSDGPHLWRSASHRFDVTVSSETGFDKGSVCLFAVPEGTGKKLDCQSLSLAANENKTVSLTFDQLPPNATGKQDLQAVVRTPNTTSPPASVKMTVTVLERGGDIDGDGLSNEREAALGTSLESNDTDGDGLADPTEVRTYKTDPANEDTDGDGLTDQTEVETHQTDPTLSDSDDDGLSDPKELDVSTDPNKADTDGDGVADGLEVNTYETDPTEADTDDDGLDDGVEINEYKTNPTQKDTDDDGLDDNLEVNTYETDPNMIDSDGDGLEDGVEVNDHQTDPTAGDSDDDGLDDGAEINTHETNPTSSDSDGDDLKDGAEVNKFETDPKNPDTDGDGQSDLVEVDRDRQDDSVLIVAGLVGLSIVAIAVGAYLFRSGWARGTPVRHALGRDGSETTSAVAGAATTTGGEQTSSSVSENQSAAADTGMDGRDDGHTDGGEPAVTDDSDGSTTVKSDAADVPPEFLSSDERVLMVLDDHDGQMPQSTLVEETEWSKSKVSRVLSTMEADGEIVKVDVGRGNIVMRPDNLPSGVESINDE